MKNKFCFRGGKGNKDADVLDEVVVDKSEQQVYSDETGTKLVDVPLDQPPLAKENTNVSETGMALDLDEGGTSTENATDNPTDLVLSNQVSLNDIDMAVVSKYCSDKFKCISADNNIMPNLVNNLFSDSIKESDEQLLRLEENFENLQETLELVDVTSAKDDAPSAKQQTDKIQDLQEEVAECQSNESDYAVAKRNIDGEKIKELPTLKTGMWFFDNINKYLDLWSDIAMEVNNKNVFKLLNLSALLRYFGDPDGNILLDKVCKSNLLQQPENQRKTWKTILEKEDEVVTPTQMVPLPSFSNRRKQNRCEVTARTGQVVNDEHYFKLYWDSTEKWLLRSFGPNISILSNLYVYTRKWFLMLARPVQVMFIRLSKVFCTLPTGPRALVFD